MKKKIASAPRLVRMDTDALVTHFKEVIPSIPSAITDEHTPVINEFCARLPTMKEVPVELIINEGAYALVFSDTSHQFPADCLSRRALRGIVKRYCAAPHHSRTYSTC
ncbi:MAG: hypothetical protein HZC01_04890 [Candidatus Kerfeldbacteria bacterium]|nr:hypothetical protein [Candidatus Kerfeldbacteria bacterium]